MGFLFRTELQAAPVAAAAPEGGTGPRDGASLLGAACSMPPWQCIAHISDLQTELRRRVRHGVEQLLLSLLLLQEAGLNLENQKDHKVLKIFYQSTLDILRSENGL